MKFPSFSIAHANILVFSHHWWLIRPQYFLIRGLGSFRTATFQSGLLIRLHSLPFILQRWLVPDVYLSIIAVNSLPYGSHTFKRLCYPTSYKHSRFPSSSIAHSNMLAFNRRAWITLRYYPPIWLSSSLQLIHFHSYSYANQQVTNFLEIAQSLPVHFNRCQWLNRS